MKITRVKLLVPRRWEETDEIILSYLNKVGKQALKGIEFVLDDQFEVGLIFIENPEILTPEQLIKVQAAVEKLNRYVLDLKNDPWTVPAIRAKTVEKMRKEIFDKKFLVLGA